MKSFMKVLISLFLAIAIGNCATISNSADSASASISKSMSDALNSLSGSVSSLSRSSKSSGDDESRYESDVEILVSIAANKEDHITLMDKDLQRIAYRNGILDYKEFRGTYTSIGSGLRLAGYNQSELQTVLQPFENRPEIQAAIKEGYGI